MILFTCLSRLEPCARILVFRRRLSSRLSPSRLAFDRRRSETRPKKGKKKKLESPIIQVRHNRITMDGKWLWYRLVSIVGACVNNINHASRFTLAQSAFAQRFSLLLITIRPSMTCFSPFFSPPAFVVYRLSNTKISCVCSGWIQTKFRVAMRKSCR